MKVLNIPLADSDVTDLSVGDGVKLSGIIVTARDAGHKYLVENFIHSSPSEAEAELGRRLEELLSGGAIYHCGPVVREVEGGGYEFVAAGPTTSAREEVYEDLVMERFRVKAIIGKGGMGVRTLEACQRLKAVYLHAVGGAGTLAAQAVDQVLEVHKLEFGFPEAFWVVKVTNFPCVVTMDSHGNSLHELVERRSASSFERLVNT